MLLFNQGDYLLSTAMETILCNVNLISALHKWQTKVLIYKEFFFLQVKFLSGTSVQFLDMNYQHPNYPISTPVNYKYST